MWNLEQNIDNHYGLASEYDNRKGYRFLLIN